MIPAPQVRSSAYLAFVEFMEKAGVPFGQWLEDDLVPSLVYRDRETLVPVHLAHSFLQRSARTLGLPELGFVVGQNARVADLGAFGRSLQRSLTLHDAVGKLRSKFPLFSSAERIWCSRVGHNVLFCHAYKYEMGVGSRYGQQCALLLMRDVVRLAAGPTWQPKHVFATPLLETMSLEQVFEGASVHRAQFSGFIFPADLLSERFSEHRAGGTSNPDHDLEPFEPSAPASDFVGSVRQVISALMKHGRFQLDEIAEAVGMHSRTLQRRLSEADEEFSQLLAEVRFEAALALLNDPKLRVIDIAHELGYRDPSNFTRAFRYWTGTTPQEFRRRRRVGS